MEAGSTGVGEGVDGVLSEEVGVSKDFFRLGHLWKE